MDSIKQWNISNFQGLATALSEAAALCSHGVCQAVGRAKAQTLGHGIIRLSFELDLIPEMGVDPNTLSIPEQETHKATNDDIPF